jgi:hypothetical protein
MKRLGGVALLTLAGISSVGAATAEVAFDFGTGPGRTTAEAAGFVVSVPDDGTVAYAPDAMVFTPGNRNFSNHSFQQGFVGMRPGDGFDFVVSTQTSIQSFSGSNNRRWGIHLFGENDLDETGLCALVIGNNDDGNRLIVFRKGLNGKDIATAVFAADGFTEGETYNFTLQGTYLNENSLELLLTVSDGLNTSSLTTTINPADYPGILTGGSTRLRKGWAIGFHNFTIKIP